MLLYTIYDKHNGFALRTVCLTKLRGSRLTHECIVVVRYVSYATKKLRENEIIK